MRGTSAKITVTVSTEELLNKLESNRENHLSNYQEAMRVWRRRCISELSAKLKSFETENVDELRKLDTTFGLRKPKSYVEAYDQAIGMLNMHEPTDITIDVDTYAAFVDDKWEWRHEYGASTMAYLEDKMG